MHTATMWLRQPEPWACPKARCTTNSPGTASVEGERKTAKISAVYKHTPCSSPFLSPLPRHNRAHRSSRADHFARRIKEASNTDTPHISGEIQPRVGN